jgi:hypothetical protein
MVLANWVLTSMICKSSHAMNYQCHEDYLSKGSSLWKYQLFSDACMSRYPRIPWTYARKYAGSVPTDSSLMPLTLVILYTVAY